MAVEAPSAPSTPAAPAAAAPAPASAPASGGDQPAWAASGGVNDFLSGVTSDRPASSPAPVIHMEPKAAESPTPAPAEAVGAPAAAPANPAVPEAAKPAEPANPASTAPATTVPAEVLLAGRFKAVLPGVDQDPGVQALAKAYDASGQEARRLLAVAAEEKGRVTAALKLIQEREATIEQFKLEKQLGPEITDPTAEESANWTPKQWADHAVNKLKREQLKDRLDTQAKQAKEGAEKFRKESSDKVFERMNFMSEQKDEFPGFDDYMRQDEKGAGPIADWMPLLPMLSGHAIAPLALYLIAKGHEALQKDKAALKATKESTQRATDLARASLPAAAGTGAGPGPQPEPRKVTPPPEAGSDEEHNANLIAAHSWGKPILPYD